MVTIQKLPESHRRIMADIARRHVILEELLGKKLSPLFQPNDPPVPLEKIMADIARREVQIEKLEAQLNEMLKD